MAPMAQTKVKRPLAHSSIGHVGYIRIDFSCGTIEGIQSLLISIFIYALMTIDAFAIVLALRQTRVKYIADLSILTKTNSISAITFSIIMFSIIVKKKQLSSFPLLHRPKAVQSFLAK